jgi:hypothetical protein
MPRKNLILLYRSPHYEQDFREIATKVHALDPNITVFFLFAGTGTKLPESEWQYPTLTVMTCAERKFPVRRGPILKCGAIDKLAQQRIFKENGIPTPPAAEFKFGMALDPILFGEFVILKPRDPRLMSHGQGLEVMRRTRAVGLSPADFPNDHPILWSPMGYIVQKFVYTGEYPSTHRVTTFLGEPVLAFTTRGTVPTPPLTSPDEVIEAADYAPKADREIPIEAYDDAVELARSVAAAFKRVPLLGIDFVRDALTGALNVLEVNAGGNTWHFSSEAFAGRRAREPEVIDRMKGQFGAFDAAARALVDNVHELAA